MSQPRWHSMLETIANVVVGIAVSLIIQITIMPLVLHVQPTIEQNMALVAIFTIASIIRGYVMRRLFNKIKYGRKEHV